MKRLATDPGTEALDAWTLRNSCGLEPVTEMPETGEELVVSRLAVLTPKQFTDLVLGDVRLATAAGMDTRACTGASDILWPVLRECAEAVAEWRQTGIGVSGDPEADTRLEQLQEHLVDSNVLITELRGQVEGLRADLMAAHERIESSGEPAAKPTVEEANKTPPPDPARRIIADADQADVPDGYERGAVPDGVKGTDVVDTARVLGGRSRFAPTILREKPLEPIAPKKPARRVSLVTQA